MRDQNAAKPTIAERIGDQRGELFRAQAVVDVCQRAVDPDKDPSMHLALEMVYDMLDGIASELDELATGAPDDPDPGEFEPTIRGVRQPAVQGIAAVRQLVPREKPAAFTGVAQLSRSVMAQEAGHG